jgi:hypothetical protein
MEPVHSPEKLVVASQNAYGHIAYEITILIFNLLGNLDVKGDFCVMP